MHVVTTKGRRGLNIVSVISRTQSCFLAISTHFFSQNYLFMYLHLSRKRKLKFQVKRTSNIQYVIVEKKSASVPPTPLPHTIMKLSAWTLSAATVATIIITTSTTSANNFLSPCCGYQKISHQSPRSVSKR